MKDIKLKRRVKNAKEMTNVCEVPLQSQGGGPMDGKSKGNGINTIVDTCSDTEELDYDYDLYIEDDEPQIVGEVEDDCQNKKATGDQARPGTSSQIDPNQMGVHDDPLTEERLMKNPILQKMMEQFFQERFKVNAKQ